ncbi:MAG: YgjV family protein [Pseudomonadota bacterium]|nr:YgjV family protein [Pseudomonadota bacterium]
MENIQYLGWAALVIYLIAPLCRIPRNTMKITTIGECFNILLYTLSMQWVGALSITLNTIRAVCAIYASDKVLRYAMIASLSLVWGATLYYLKFPYDILIAFAATSIAFSQKNRDNFYAYRSFVILSQILWIMHSYLTGMHTMMVTCAIMAAVHLVTVSYYAYKAYRNTGTFNISASQ